MTKYAGPNSVTLRGAHSMAVVSAGWQNDISYSVGFNICGISSLYSILNGLSVCVDMSNIFLSYGGIIAAARLHLRWMRGAIGRNERGLPRASMMAS